MQRLIKNDLTDPKAKISRAKVHLESLRYELQIFSKTKPYRFIPHDDLERQRHSIRFEMDDPHPEVWLVAGDLFYCLRSALDQLVFCLAKLNIPYPEGTQFPILDKDIASDPKIRKRFDRLTLGVPTEAIAMIESLQPYKRVDPAAIQSHFLWRLNRMCNIDKHRRIPIHGDETIFNFPGLPVSTRAFIELDEKNQMVSLPMRYKDQMRLDPIVHFKIYFGDASDGIMCDIQGIESIYNFIANEVLPGFSCFFK